MPEALSTARPTPLRLAGSLCLLIGGALLGIGAVSTWGTIGFSPDVDPDGVLTAVIPGTDLWEGKLVLACALVVLAGVVALRLVRRTATRRLIAVVITVVGFGAGALAATTALNAEDRLGRGESLDAAARIRAEETGVSFEQARRDIEEVFGDQLIAETGSGVWIAAVGGIVAGIGGILSLLWVRQRERANAEPEPPKPLLA